MSPREHWDRIHRASTKPSWYRPRLDVSLEFLDTAGLRPTAAIIDVGGGDSTFVDSLLERGYSDITVLDISPVALANARERLGPRALGVSWIEGDITRTELPIARFDFWHDRAVFHFLIDGDSRARYVAAVRRSLKPGGHLVVATFGPAGPKKCSGLEVARYSPDALQDQFGEAFGTISDRTEQHVTPAGAKQEFVYCWFRMR